MEHRFRGDRDVDAEGAFDWRGLAEGLRIAPERARDLYEEAVRQASERGGETARELYLAWLEAAAQDGVVEPGRQTATMRIGGGALRRRAGGGGGRRAELPGKRPWTAHLRGGRALPGDVVSRLAPHVGEDAAGAARVHTDEVGERIAAAHQARAVAIGDEIYFARGEYAPGTAHGDELLAHELTHVAQARRGDLEHGRAAAKGIDSGSTLDPAEAEADLRAKLAVLQLHAPEVPAPELAAPVGQPATDAERLARLDAQQARLALVEGDAGVPVEAVVTPVPASTPQAAVPHPAPELTAAGEASAAESAYVETFTAPPSEQALERWEATGAAATEQAAADHAAFTASLQPLPVVLDGSEPPAPAGGAPEHAAELAPVEGAPPPSATAPPTPTPPPVTAAAEAAAELQPLADPAQMRASAEAAMAALPTTLPPVVTEPGPAPVTELAGQADPARALGDHQQAMTEGAEAFEAEREKILKGPGAAQVQPVVLDEQLEIPAIDAGGAMPELPTVEGMAKLKQWALPPEAQGAFDEVAKPKLEANLAEARAKMTEAQTQRDADRAKAIDEAHEKVRVAHEDADRQQQTKVAETRTSIANRQAETLAKQQGEVQKLEQQSGEQRKSTVTKIQDRLATDQAKVETDYADARTRADDERRRGEEDVARRRREAEEEANRDRSWWEQIADAICDAVQQLAEEIDQALDAIGEAIGAILDAVKEAACAVIDAARDFVCQALTEFGDWLQSAVTALIGSVFPELAAELNRLIDEAVTAATEAVTAIADGLKEAVTALCDGLKAAVEAAIAAFQAAVQAAATFVQALVTGDWSLVAKLVLDGILQLLGIDPAAFYALVGSAQASLEAIVADPGAFVGHLVDAVKLGFSQFGDNFWTHLQSGVVQWLFGTFSEAGIQMPASFDVAGIFSLVMQVLGLTWDRLRVKVVDLIGEENTERLEFVAGYLEALVTGGLEGLWAQVQQDLSQLWDMVIGGIRDWLIETVVQQAIIKIATMWNPAGAIIQLIQTAWNTYQWLRENAQRIFGLVQAVVDSIAEITAGNIGGAANWIEQSLAQLLPIAISMFANLIGLGGIADHLRGIIERIQQQVSDAIDALIERVKALFRGGSGDGAGDGAGDGDDSDVPMGIAIAFTAEGDGETEPHRLWVESAGGTPYLMVASDEMPPRDQLAQFRRLATTDNDATALRLLDPATAAVDDAEAALETRIRVDGTGEEAEEQAEQALEAAERTLVQHLKGLFDHFLGGMSQWFKYKLTKGAVGQPHDRDYVENSGGAFSPGAPHVENAYIATIASAAALESADPANITPPERIGRAYQGAFDDPADLQTRFGLVVGINTHDDIAGEGRRRVRSNVDAGANQVYPWGVMGFLWQSHWLDEGGAPVQVEEVRDVYDKLDPERKMIVAEYERRNRSRVPMGEIRDVIHQSRFTGELQGLLQPRADRVFVQVGDNDIVSLNPSPSLPAYFNRFDDLVQVMVDDIAEHARSDGPIIATGGYELTMQIGPDEGGTAATDVRAVLGAKLDMAVRQAMASVDAGSVYFPEPNMIIQLTPDTVTARFGNPALESRGLVENVAHAHPNLLFNRYATMITSTPPRMLSRLSGARMTRLWAEIPEITSRQLWEVFNRAQSHARKINWIRQVRDSYAGGEGFGKVLGRLYNECVPIGASIASFEPVEDLHQKVRGLQVPDLSALSGLRDEMIPMLGSPSRPTTGASNGAPLDVANTVCNLGIATGQAVRDWLLALLDAIESGQPFEGL